jgi:hypothetical protein
LVGRHIENYGRELFHDKVLISEENMSACPYAGRPPRALDMPWMKRYQNAMGNLAVLFPGAHVIMGVRKHEGWLLSLYKQYLHQGGMKTFDKFFDIRNPDSGVIRPSDLYLKPRIDLLHELFPGCVFVYDSSDLSRNRPEVVGELCRFMGENVPEEDKASARRRANKGVNHYQAELLRVLNHIDRMRYIRTWTVSRVLCQKFLSNWPRRPLELPVDVRSYIRDHYSDDWNAVRKQCYQPDSHMDKPFTGVKR